MLLHIQHGCKEVTICCTDTDFVVLAVATFQQLGLEILWIGFGMNKNFRWLPIHAISKDLGIRAVGLPFFHAFTGCDTVPAFHGKGKKSAWKTWEVFPDATDVFTRLSKRHDTFAVDNARLERFAKNQRSYDAIPPTFDALMEHTKRAVYQGGLVWGQTLECFQCLP